MKRFRRSAKEQSAQDGRTITVLNAPPTAIPTILETTLFVWLLLFLLLGGIFGCLITGFSIPVYTSILCAAIPALSILLPLWGRIPKGPLSFLHAVPFLVLLLYTWQRFEVLREGFSYIAAAILRYLCWGFPGLTMPQMLSEYEQFLLHAETNDLLYASIRAPITESILYACVGIGIWWIILYQKYHLVWLSAALPLPAFVFCFLIIETTIPALWALLLVLLYWVLLLFTRTTVSLHIRAASAQAMVLLVPCILFLSAVYLWYPKQTPVGTLVQNGYDKVMNTLSAIESTVSGTAGNLFSGGWFSVSAEGSEISFESLGPRRFLGKTVMRAKSDTPGVIYLRENTYGSYTQDGWKQLVFDSDEQIRRSSFVQTAAAQILASNPVLVSRLTLDGARSSLLFSPYYFSDASIPYALDGDGRIANPERISDYEIEFYRFSGNFNTLQYNASSASIGLTNLMDYAETTLPAYREIDEDLAEELRAILNENGIASHTDNLIVQNNGSVHTYYGSDLWDTVTEITHFVRNSAEYSLDAVKNPTDRDFVLWFLEDAEYGYCTHFATAEVMLLRACGIPARLASGFLGSIRSANQWTAIKDSNAHAWVEVFDTHLGWIPVEATPPSAIADGIDNDAIIVGVTPISESSGTPAHTEAVTETEPLTDPIETEALSDPIESADTQPSQPDQTDPDPTDDDPSDASGSDEQGGGHSTSQKTVPNPGRILWILLSIGLVVTLPMLLRKTRQKQIAVLLAPDEETRNASVLHLYRRCISLARACGEELPASLTVLAEKARFSQHVLTSEEMDIMVGWYHNKCAQLQMQDKPLSRLRHFWIDLYY